MRSATALRQTRFQYLRLPHVREHALQLLHTCPYCRGGGKNASQDL